jgi:hypothetical protein
MAGSAISNRREKRKKWLIYKSYSDIKKISGVGSTESFMIFSEVEKRRGG